MEDPVEHQQLQLPVVTRSGLSSRQGLANVTEKRSKGRERLA